MVMKKRARQRPKRKAKALRVAARMSYLGLALGAGLGAGAFMLLVPVAPTVSSKQIADAVRAQVTRGAVINPLSQTSIAPAADALIPPNTISTSPDKQQFLPIAFEQLAGFRFVVTDQILDAGKDARDASSRTTEQIPSTIKLLNGRPVSVKGYMLPMNFSGALVTDFLLMRSQSMCCYGMAPKITEWVNVRMAGKGIKPLVDQPVTVSGTFHVGEVRENGDLVGIYRLDGEKLTRD